MNDNYYSRAAASSPEPSLEGGASGYFTAPSDTLDPHLFDGREQIRYEVRARIWRTLHQALQGYMLQGVNHWLYAWLAGSGITYQWNADRGNGDLDVLFGVDYAELLKDNPAFRGLSEAQFADELDDWLRENVWPHTAATDFNGQIYEVTFFLNPGTGTDIKNIHPYAALDLKSGEWVVRPPEVAHDPESMYPKEWFTVAQRDVDSTGALLRRYTDLVAGTAGLARDREVRLREVTGNAQALFNEIHGGRREAFGGQGQGYGDFHNFRWQAAKRTGVVQALHGMAGVGEQAHAAEDIALYGEHILGASEALARAAMVARTRKQR